MIIYVSDYKSFIYTKAKQNCKLCYIDSIGYSLTTHYDSCVKRLNELFNVVRKLVFTINVLDKRHIDKLSKNFTLIYCNKVPIGYGSGYQYHACFLTNCRNYGGYKTYLKRIEKQQKENDKNFISKKLVKKILSYKSKKWLEKYLNKYVKEN